MAPDWIGSICVRGISVDGRSTDPASSIVRRCRVFGQSTMRRPSTTPVVATARQLRYMVGMRWTVLGGVTFGAVLCLGSCARDRPAPVLVAPPRLAPPPPPRPEEPAPYILAPSVLRKQPGLAPEFPDGDGGVVIGGVRISARRTEPTVARDLTQPPLKAGVRVPTFLGGGYLFWSPNGLYASSTFIGDFQPVLSTRGTIESVSFGPTFALIRDTAGERWALDLPSRTAKKPSPVGLVDVAALADGRAVAVLEGGRVAVSIDAGKTWKDETARLISAPTKLQSEPDAIWFAQSSGPAWRLEKDGALRAFPSVPAAAAAKVSADPHWTLQESPIERALRYGAAVDDWSAVVEANGVVVTVDMRTGEVVNTTRAILPPGLHCEALRATGDVLIVCEGSGAAHFVIAGTRSREPRLDKSFSAPGNFASAQGGALLFSGPCDSAERRSAVICIRGHDGVWTEHDVRNAIAGADGGATMEVARWIPAVDGGAVGVITTPEFGLVNAVSNVLTVLPKDAAVRSLSSISSYAHGRPLDRTWEVRRDGALQGWTPDGVAMVTMDGNVQKSAYRWPAVATVGALGFARDKEGRAWQTDDFGHLWTEVLAPPGGLTGGGWVCSDAGCVLGTWLRPRWRNVPPTSPQQHHTAQVPPLATVSVRPTLVCSQAAEPRAQEVRLAGGPQQEADTGFGARQIVRSRGETTFFKVAYAMGPQHPVHNSGESYGLGALLYAMTPSVIDTPSGEPAPANMAQLEHPYNIWWLDLSSAALSVRNGAVRLRELAAAAGPNRGALLGLNTDAELRAIPVLGREPGSADGWLFLVQSPVGVWVRQRVRASVLPLSFGQENVDWGAPVSAAALGDDLAAALLIGSDGATRVMAVGPSKTRKLFEIPAPPDPHATSANPDALAIDKDNVAVIRLPSGSEPPSSEDPALVYDNGTWITLAPWSTLTPGDASECASEVLPYRAVIQTIGSWVRLVDTTVRAPDDTGMLAWVRWGARRVCIDAVTVKSANTQVGDRDVEVVIHVRFTGKPFAARMAITQGAELRQAVSCRLDLAKIASSTRASPVASAATTLSEPVVR